MILDNYKKEHRIIWLSHIINENTQLYGGAKGIRIKSEKSIMAGDSCNTSVLSFPNHVGSHVDTPRHFIENGMTVDAYVPDEWIFSNPLLLDVSIQKGEEINSSSLPTIDFPDDKIDILLIRTGFEKFRGTDIFWQESPVVHPDLFNYIRVMFPNLRALALDIISISSLKNREIGRIAHRVFLKANILLFEEISLAHVKNMRSLKQVIALPLRFSNGSGAPCTIIGWEKV